MRAKKLLAVALSLAMLIGLFPFAGLSVVADEVTGTEVKTVYVSGNAAEAADGSTSAAPTTLADALAKIKEADAATFGSGVIVVVDALTLEADSTIDVGKPLTITSELSTAPVVTMSGRVMVENDLTLDKIEISVGSTANTDWAVGFMLNGVNFTATQNFKSGVGPSYTSATYGPAILLGNNKGTVGKSDVKLYGGYFADVIIGSLSAETTFTEGANVLVDGAQVLSICFNRDTRTTHFQDDVNIILKSGAVSSAGVSVGIGARGTVTFTDGSIVNLIKYADFTYTKDTDFRNIVSNTAARDAVRAVRRWINVDANGGTLTPDAEDDIKYAVSGYKTANAVATDSDVAVSSVNGVLTLDAAGIYNVNWSKSTAAKTIYVDAENGDDTLGTGYTAASALKTLTAALDDAAGRESATVMLAGAFTLPDTFDAAGTPIVLTRMTGAAEQPQLTFPTIVFKSDVVLDDVNLVASGAVTLDACAFETTENFVKTVAASSPHIYMANAGSASVENGRSRLTLNDTQAVKWGNVYVSPKSVNKTAKLAGANITLRNKAGINDVLLVSPAGTSTVYTDNVNVAMYDETTNTGGFEHWLAESNGVCTRYVEFVEGKGLHIIDASVNFAKTAIAHNNTGGACAPYVEALNGDCFWVAYSDAANEITMTDKLGVFNIGDGKTAVASTDGLNDTRSQNGLLTLPMAGRVYNVSWLGDPTPLTVYVSQTGTGDGLSKANPTDWAGAFAALKDRESGTIKLVGAVTLPEEIPAVTTGELTITSADGSQAAVTMSGHVAIKNDIKLDNMKVILAGKNTVNNMDYAFYIHNADFKTTASFASGEATGVVNTASVDQRAPYINFNENTTDKVTIELKGGTFGMVNMANKVGAVTLGPIDVIVDGNVQLQDISFDRYGNNNTTYTGDINLYLKNGSIVSGGFGIGARGNKGTVADGVKINILKYAGFTWSKTDIVNIIVSQTSMYNQVMAARRWIEVGEGGSIASNDEGSFDAIADKNGYRALLSDEEKALRYSAADKLEIPDEAGHYAIEWRKVGGIRTVYVSADGTGDGWTAATPTTIDKALSDNLVGQETGVIRLLGDVTLPATIPETTAGTITITKAAAAPAKPNATLNTSTKVYNHLILDNVHVVAGTTYDAGAGTPNFALSGVQFTTTKNMTSDGIVLFMGAEEVVPEKSTVLLQGGTIERFHMGSFAGKAATVPGGDITIDGATVKDIWEMSRTGYSYTTFTDNVNLSLRSGSLTGVIKVVHASSTINAGKFINVFQYADFTYAKTITVNTGITADNYRWLKLPAEVTNVTLGEEMGQLFFEPENMTFGTSDGTAKTYRGEITLPNGGVYTFQKLADPTGDNTPDTTLPEGKVVYISADGAGNKDGTSPENAYDDERASWVAACKTTPISNVLRIKIVGDGVALPTVASNSGHLQTQSASTKLIVEGATEGTPAQVTLSGQCNIRGNVTLDNMFVAISAAGSAYFDIYSTTNKPSTLTFGYDFKSGALISSGYGSTSLQNSPQIMFGMQTGGGGSAPVTVNIHGGTFREVILGVNNSPSATTLNGATLVVDGPNVEVGAIQLGARSAVKTVYAGDVNIILKNGAVSSHNGANKYICAARTDGISTYNDGVVVRVLQSTAMKTIPASAAPINSYLASSIDTTTVIPFYKMIVPAALMDAVTPGDSGATFQFASAAKTMQATYTYDDKGAAPSATVSPVLTSGGIFTLTDKGIYTVGSWRENNDAKDIYVDSELGDDIMGDGGELNPYKTLAAALDDATGRDAATIYLIGEATLAQDPPALAGGLTIVGVSTFETVIDPDTNKEVEKEHQANITQAAHLNLRGDLTLDNIRWIIPTAGSNNNQIHMHGINFTTTDTFRSGLNSAADETPGQSKGPRVFMSSLTVKNTLNLAGSTVFESLWIAPQMATKAESHPGVDVTAANGCLLGMVYLNFNSGNYQLTYTDDVNITLSDNARYTQIQTFNNCANGRHVAKFAEGKSVIVFNLSDADLEDAQKKIVYNSTGTYLCDTCGGALIVPYFLHAPISWDMRGSYGLEPTGTAGQFTIKGDKMLASVNEDGSVAVANKTVSLQPGYHSYIFMGFDELPTPQAALNNLFLGWKKDGAYVRADNMPTGMFTLTPAYQAVTGDNLFTDVGAQLREEDNALRLMVQMNKDFYKTINAVFGESERGMVLITNAMLGGEDLTLEGIYTYKNAKYIASKVVAKNTMASKSTETHTVYNATLKGISASNAKLAYAYRGYITYVNKNGIEQTLYASEQNNASVWKAIKDIPNEELTDSITELMAAVNAAGDPSAMYKADGTQSFNPASLYNNKTSKATEINTAANTIRNNVLTSADRTDLHITGEGVTTYYISGDENASDENDGTSMDAPLRTTNNAKIYAALKAGNCNILFERGYVYRESALMVWGSNVFVGAYGTGFKPILVGSDKNYAEKAEDWTLADGTTDVWKVDVTEIMDHTYATEVIPTTAGDGATVEAYVNLYASDIGAIVFDHGRMMASTGKVMSNDKELINDFNDELVQEQLANDYDFWSAINPEDGKYYVYLKLSAGNPAEQFTGIEMLPNRYIVYANNPNASNIRVDNLSLKYSSDGVGTSGVDDVSITNCEMGYMGGSIFDSMGDDGMTPSYQRHGNGITLYGKINGALVENNWIYQCYDDAYTNQADLDTQENITVKANLFEYSLYGMTMWTGKHHSRPNQSPIVCDTDVLRNILVEDNVMRFAGYGHGTFNRGRFGSSTIGATHISVGSGYSRVQNVVVQNNYFDTSYRHLVRATYYPGADEYVFIGNTWNQNIYTRLSDLADVRGTTSMVARVTAGPVYADGVDYTCATENEMYTSVNVIDVAPKNIYHDGKLVTETPSK